jgi:hypothetical protein
MGMKLEARQMKLALGASLLALALSAAGCKSDKKTVPSDAGMDASADAAATPQACIAEAKKMGSKTPAAMLDCLCNSCLQEMTDCNADKGCIEIRTCTDTTGCRGINDCYLGKALCRDVIDKWGSTSLSTTLSQQLGDCNAANCGVDAGVHTTCPSQAVMAMGMGLTLSGCCAANNLCGLMDDFVTMSCIERSAFPASFTGGMSLKKQTCDGTPLADDAGMSMMPDAAVAPHDDGGANDAGN